MRLCYTPRLLVNADSRAIRPKAIMTRAIKQNGNA